MLYESSILVWVNGQCLIACKIVSSICHYRLETSMKKIQNEWDIDSRTRPTPYRNDRTRKSNLPWNLMLYRSGNESLIIQKREKRKKKLLSTLFATISSSKSQCLTDSMDAMEMDKRATSKETKMQNHRSLFIETVVDLLFSVSPFLGLEDIVFEHSCLKRVKYTLCHTICLCIFPFIIGVMPSIAMQLNWFFFVYRVCRVCLSILFFSICWIIISIASSWIHNSKYVRMSFDSGRDGSDTMYVHVSTIANE